LDDKKPLNDMRIMKMPSVLFKRNNPNVHNREEIYFFIISIIPQKIYYSWISRYVFISGYPK